MLTDQGSVMQLVDRQLREVFVEEWNDSVLLKPMQVNERDLWEKKFQGNKFPDVVRAALVAKCLVNQEGQRLFSDQEALLLGEKCAAAIDRLFEICMSMNRFTKADIEVLTKNS